MSLGLFMLFYVICGVLTYGLTIAHFQKAYPSIAKETYHDDVHFARLISLLGPGSLLGFMLFKGFKSFEHGLQFTRKD